MQQGAQRAAPGQSRYNPVSRGGPKGIYPPVRGGAIPMGGLGSSGVWGGGPTPGN